VRRQLGLDTRSYIAQSDGLYRFHGLRPHIDYSLKADYGAESGSLLKVPLVDGG